MQHRGTARTRIVPVLFDRVAPAVGTEIRAADKPIGTMGSSAAGRGLALVRTDRATDALDTGAALTAGDITLRLADPDAVRASAAKKSVA
jgi:folate-binding Fe-S cluster repair protein YgfZ